MDNSDAEPTHVLPHVFLGSKVHARDRALLARLQITHVLNVTPPKALDPVAGVPNFFEKDKTLTYRRCPIFDNKAEDISGVLEGCVAFMAQAKFYGRILVHCSKGISRSTSMVVAYLMKHEDMCLDDALAFVVAKRPVANPNASFRQQLEDFGEKLRRAAAAAAKSASSNRNRVAGVRGPHGPALPPSQPARKTVCDDDDTNATAIGPQLPPHLQRNKTTTPSNSSVTTATATATAMVTAMVTAAVETSEHDGTDDATPTDDDASPIGPQLPPHLIAARKRTRDDPVVTTSNSSDGPEAKAARIDDAARA